MNMFLRFWSGLVVVLLAATGLGAAPRIYVGNFKDNTVSVIDTKAATVLRTIPVAPGPHGMALSPDGQRLFVSSDGASIVSVINTATDKVDRTIEVGKSPHGLAIVPASGLLLVAVNGDDRIAFVDLNTYAVVGGVAVGKPHTIAARPDGRMAYVSSQSPGHFALVSLDLTTKQVTGSVPLTKPPRDLEYDGNGKILYFTQAGTNALEVLNPETKSIVAEIPTGVSPHYVAHFQSSIYGMAVVQGPGELLLFDPKSLKSVRSIKVGNQPHWLALSADGRTAYVTNEGANTVSVIDVASGTSSLIPVGNQPRKIVVQSATSTDAVLIENFTFLPAVLSIRVGESVHWRNGDGGPHAIAFHDGFPGSDSLFPGQSFSRLFAKPGDYEYYCSIHTYMTGRIIVRGE